METKKMGKESVHVDSFPVNRVWVKPSFTMMKILNCKVSTT